MNRLAFDMRHQFDDLPRCKARHFADYFDYFF